MNQTLAVMPWYAWVAIVAIVGGVVSGLITSIFQHQERMAMIRMGMHPDQKRDPEAACEVEKPYHPQGIDL
jgi:uncharacterized membrane protein (DUF106 family)